MKQKSSKLSTLERNRKSILTDDLEHCIICGKKRDHLHEIYEGKNRQNSMKYNCVLPLCYKHHILIHQDRKLSLIWKVKCQKEFEKTKSREAFISIFRRSYL